MKIYMNDQLLNPAYPPKCLIGHTGAALPVELCGIPMFYNGLRVSGVKCRVTNADGLEIEVSCERRGANWYTLYAATNFLTYGYVAKGFRVKLVLADDDNETSETVLAVGDIDIRSSSPTASPGTPGAHYVTKGGELFVRSQVVGGVQHFVKQEMEYDAEIGWGANWTGDYVLDASGNYIPFVTE